MTNGSLMEVESIAECSPWSILQYFWPALSDDWSWKTIFDIFETGRFRQVFLYRHIFSWIVSCPLSITAKQNYHMHFIKFILKTYCELIFSRFWSSAILDFCCPSEWKGNSTRLKKQERRQRSGIDTIKHHTWFRIPMGKWQLHN